jgi:GNAT superfamily N-acetyltransferase
VDVSARPALPDDVGVLGELATLAIEELTPNRGGEVWRRQLARPIPPDDSLAADIADDDAHVLVGTIDEVPVGYAVVRIEALADGGRLGVLSDLYTHPEARAVAIGETMMDAVIEWCREQGCFGVDSIALPGDRHTKNFFESFGLVARAIIVHRSLEDG